ncbi:hypothetical protein CLHUN_04700 [Ruminiclostridium hungatei]|uniref:Uncharacterized protein n=1 Tax=Ruminiclostridium hungatei TaxID=48256 RepID=A0A1V4SRC4_RUMHU|nr:hypothetical protein CLHUN_04700 [Ruminiclostridium hungatei]
MSEQKKLTIEDEIKNLSLNVKGRTHEHTFNIKRYSANRATEQYRKRLPKILTGGEMG